MKLDTSVTSYSMTTSRSYHEEIWLKGMIFIHLYVKVFTSYSLGHIPDNYLIYNEAALQ